MIGGLKGLCGSLAVFLALHGATNLAVLSRSGYDDTKSKSIVRQLSALNTQIDLVQGDVINREDVQRVFSKTKKPIGGIIHGAMILRVRFATTIVSLFNVYRTKYLHP